MPDIYIICKQCKRSYIFEEYFQREGTSICDDCLATLWPMILNNTASSVQDIKTNQRLDMKDNE